ncbi:LOW QUALITY PROTEIN: 2-aminoethylphosphonate--pyruvate transaminase-like [Liolophura sinensis]|uniref:LOW QUALITY PROTEIN: 2-aminoethylphosphonate--pyruvate transaminase-like n=1 Tax=Liolophura sinensis TaxID=3198878 RepID=UPI0031596BC8
MSATARSSILSTKVVQLCAKQNHSIGVCGARFAPIGKFAGLVSSFASRRFYSENGSGAKDKKLFTPGPLGTSPTVKQAMLRDLGSRDVEFVETVRYIRSKLTKIAGVSSSEFTCIPVQGSGTYGVEAVFQSTVPRQNGKVLVFENGAYGKRLAKICEKMGVDHHVESFPEDDFIDFSRVQDIVKADNSFTNVAAVHCETSSGVINPVDQIGGLVETYLPNATCFVDAMSSFGAVPIDVAASGIDYIVSSANKCVEGVPGFAYVIARIEKLRKCKGFSRSLSLDLVDQYETLETTGQFRFTPPTHAMLAFRQALDELELEGGVRGRASRYRENREILKEGMAKLGFKELLDDRHDGYIITSYHYPKDPKFSFKDFYTRLNDKDQVIYPGKVLNADCFRIGNIGYLKPADMKHLMVCVEEVCKDMGLKMPLDSEG